MADDTFPLWGKGKSIPKLGPGYYDNLSTLNEPHFDPRLPPDLGNWLGVPQPQLPNQGEVSRTGE